MIGYNPTWDDLPRDQPAPPAVVLYHELAHIYDHFHGTVAAGTYEGADNQGVPNRERVAVGLPIDHDGDPVHRDRAGSRPPVRPDRERPARRVRPASAAPGTRRCGIDAPYHPHVSE